MFGSQFCWQILRIFQISRVSEVSQGGLHLRSSWSSSSSSEPHWRLWCWPKSAHIEGAATEPWTHVGKPSSQPPFLYLFIPPIKRWFWGWISIGFTIHCAFVAKFIITIITITFLAFVLQRLRLIWRRPCRSWDAFPATPLVPYAGELPLVMMLGEDDWSGDHKWDHGTQFVIVCPRNKMYPRVQTWLMISP